VTAPAELQTPGGEQSAALELFKRELTPPQCETEGLLGDRCSNTATWAATHQHPCSPGAGFACESCKTDLDGLSERIGLACRHCGQRTELIWIRL
jgi:hypothetical protein